jgi:hypothetical protein
VELYSKSASVKPDSIVQRPAVLVKRGPEQVQPSVRPQLSRRHEEGGRTRTDADEDRGRVVGKALVETLDYVYPIIAIELRVMQRIVHRLFKSLEGRHVHVG